MRRHVKSAIVFLALGLATTLGLAWLMTLAVDVQAGSQTQAEAYTDDEQWAVTRWDRAGAIQIKSVRIKGLNWSPQQAAGAPDTKVQGDQVTAWASRTSDGGTEWLELEYAKPVVAREIDVYESHNPGALFRVTIFDAGGKEIEAWSGADPTPPASVNNASPVPVSKVRISSNVSTKRVRLYLAADKVPGWNEVDAVALISDAGELQWARHVRASSTYASASGFTGGGNPAQLVPPWSGLDRPSSPWESGIANREERLIDARGWPLVALMSATDSLASPVSASGATSPRATVYSRSLGGLPSSSVAISTPSPNRTPVPLPVHPVWFGLIGDTVIYSIAWVILWMILTIPRRFIIEVARCRRGACIACGYDLGFDFIHGCSECGWRRDRIEPSRARMHLAGKSNGD